ncbi:hypothetical protein GGH20_003722, partial [Coemansia sp. RSA 1937]
MCAYRSTATFEERGIRPPPWNSATVGESDLKFIHLRDGEDTGLLQYVRSGGIAFPHIMVPDQLQIRGVAKLSTNEPVGGVSALHVVGDQSEQDSVVLQNKEADEANSALSTMVSHALWLWNAKQNIAELITRAQTR